MFYPIFVYHKVIVLKFCTFKLYYRNDQLQKQYAIQNICC